MQLAGVLEKDLDYFLMDTPYVNRERLIDHEIAAKLNQCNMFTLIVLGKMLDVLLEYQHTLNTEQNTQISTNAQASDKDTDPKPE